MIDVLDRRRVHVEVGIAGTRQGTPAVLIVHHGRRFTIVAQFVGIAELAAAIRGLRSSKPDYRFVIASEIDHQHGRLRYRWDMISHGRTLMEGLDVVTLDAPSGLIARVDGFFGQPTPIDPVASGIPLALRSAPLGVSTAWIDGDARPTVRGGRFKPGPVGVSLPARVRRTET